MVDAGYLVFAWFVIYFGAVTYIPDFSKWAENNPWWFLGGLFFGVVVIALL